MKSLHTLTLAGLVTVASLTGSAFAQVAIAPNETVAFCGSTSTPDGWIFLQALPIGNPTHLTKNNDINLGYQISLNAKNAFGLIGTNDSNDNSLPSPGEGKVMRATFAVSSNQASAFGVPTIRLRIGARDGSFTQTHTFQEGSPSNTAPVVVPISSDPLPRNLQVVCYAPASLDNNVPNFDSNGSVLTFDVLQFGSGNGNVGSTLSIRYVFYDILDPATLTGENEILNLDFTSSSHNFTPIDFKPNNSAVTGILPSNLGTSGGLTIEPTGNPQSDANQIVGVRFSFGIWQKTFNVASGEPWLVQANKIYRIDYRLDSDAPGFSQSHTSRMRFTVGDNDFVGDATVTPTQDSTSDPRGGKSYIAFIKFPDSCAGLPVTAAFDVFKVNNTSMGTITLKNLTVTSYDSTSATLYGFNCS